MKNFYLSKSRRLRSTPFSSRIERQGVKSYTVYNHMLLPTSFSSPEEEYKHLKENVQIWDVSVQREIEILEEKNTAESRLLLKSNNSSEVSKTKANGIQEKKTRNKPGRILLARRS